MFPKGDHANLGVGGWESEGPRLREHLAGSARAYGDRPDALDRACAGTGCRCAARGSMPARDRVAARRRRRRARRPALGRRDVRGVRLRPARLRARSILAGDGSRAYADRARRSALDHSRRRARGRRSARSTASRAVVRGRARCRCVRPSSRACSAATSRTRARPEGWRGRRSARRVLRALRRSGRRFAARLKDARAAADASGVMDLIAPAPARRRARRQRHSPEARPAAGRPAATATSSRSDGAGSLGEADLEDVLDDGHGDLAPRRDAFDETGDLDIAFSHPTLPRFRVNGFRQRGAISFAFRVIPSEIPNFDDARPPARRHPARRGAPRARARHRRDRLGQDDDARGDDRPHQPDAAPAHRHDRGPDRDPPPRPRLHRQPARGRARHRSASTRRCAACCARTRT